MAKSLVVVESRAKAKTIQKYLGAGFQVLASMGHVRDLPKGDLGVDVENDFRPDYARLGRFRARLKFPQTIALTATATPEGTPVRSVR